MASIRNKACICVEVEESAGIPLDLNHHSGHCPSFHPPDQKQLSMVCPTLLAAFQTGFMQMMFDFGFAIKVLTESRGWIMELLADFWVVSSASICSVIYI